MKGICILDGSASRKSINLLSSHVIHGNFLKLTHVLHGKKSYDVSHNFCAYKVGFRDKTSFHLSVWTRALVSSSKLLVFDLWMLERALVLPHTLFKEKHGLQRG